MKFTSTMALYLVTFRTRALSSGWIKQTSVINAESPQKAIDQLNGSLARLYKTGAWFIDWQVEKAELVG